MKPNKKTICYGATAMMAIGALGLAGTARHSPLQTRVEKKSAEFNTRVEITGLGTMKTGWNAPPQRFQMHFDARIHRDILLQPDRSRQVIYHFTKSKYRMTVNDRNIDQVSSQVEQALLHPVRVHVAPNGAIRTVYASNQMPPAARGILRALICSTQAENDNSNNTAERDEGEPDLLPGATIHVRYRRNGNQATRSRLRLNPMRRKWGIEEAMEHFQAGFNDTGSLAMDSYTGEPVQGEIILSCTLKRGIQPISDSWTKISLTNLNDPAPITPNAESTLPSTGSGEDTEDILVTSNFAGAERKLFQNTLGKETFDTLARQTESAQSQRDIIGIDRKWRSLLILQPDQWPAFRKFALRQTGMHSILIASALMQVGNSEAQQTLMEMYEQRRGSSDAAELINYLAGVELPDPRMVAYLTSLTRKDAEEGYYARVALGIAARQWSDDAPIQALQLVRLLEAQANDSSQSVQGREAALLGLGNSACSEAWDTLRKLAENTQSTIACAAIRAMRRLKLPAALETLKRLEQGSNPMLRQAAQQAIRYQISTHSLSRGE